MVRKYALNLFLKEFNSNTGHPLEILRSGKQITPRVSLVEIY